MYEARLVIRERVRYMGKSRVCVCVCVRAGVCVCV
jgi:hypothetical protein